MSIIFGTLMHIGPPDPAAHKFWTSEIQDGGQRRHLKSKISRTPQPFYRVWRNFGKMTYIISPEPICS